MDVFVDKSWVKLNRAQDHYRKSLVAFLDHAFATSALDNKIACPCGTCANRFYHDRELVMKHMIIKGMDVEYQKCIWVFHGESRVNDGDTFLDSNPNHVPTNASDDDIVNMVEDAFEFHDSSSTTSGINDEAQNFFKLLDDARQPLYPGCEEFTKLSFIVELYHLKCLYGITNVAFDALVNLFKRALPKDSTLPSSFSMMQTIIKKLGLDYKEIDVCPNDCVLFWKEKKGFDKCPVCDESRWKTTDDGTLIKLVSGDNVPKKVLRHFPLIPRLKRLFMSSKTVDLMTWHASSERLKDGKLRHPADSKAWKDFDIRFPLFARDPRNVRLGLASDGFNPFGVMSSQYSIWPVVLMTYNLPPWLCMKQSFFMLSLIIPGPKGPSNDIDVFLEPLMDELELLWEVGVNTYDASKGETFTLRGAVLWTINDFPAYGNLSGWKTKGYHACPHCNINTNSCHLKGSKKICYMDHRCFLEENHKFRRNRRAFNGKVELRPPPKSWTGLEVLQQMEDVNVVFGKHPSTQKLNRESRKRKRGDRDIPEVPWKKISIFYRLPYWQHLEVRHNLDVMHVEKNVSENIIGTLFGIDGKTKDTLQSRADLVALNIKHNLHPVEQDGKTYIPPASFTLSKKEKEEMLSVLSSIRVPDGYAANIRRRVIDGKISCLKSHDHHILMQQLLPLALRKMKNKDVARVLIELSNFFKDLCSKVATPEDFEKLEKRIVVTLCHLERIFLPAFFDIMVHLVQHLPYEAKILGPVFDRWMYPVERYLQRLQSYVGNKSRPEASIAQGVLAEECLGFCARYLHDVETRENRSMRNNDDTHEVVKGLSVFCCKWRAMSKKTEYRPDYSVIEQAHSYILANCEDVQVYGEDHYGIVAEKYCGMQEFINETHQKEFPKWFADNVSRHIPSDVNKANDLKYLSSFPSMWVNIMTKVTCNGYRWRVKNIDKGYVTQNSGVLVIADTNEGKISYYGILTEIVEVIYPHLRSVLLFRCDWVDPIRGVKQDELGFTLVNHKAILKTNEPFVLASQALQVFYVADSKEGNWHVVVVTKPRDLFDMEEDMIPEVDHFPVDLTNQLNINTLSRERQDLAGVMVDELLDNVLGNTNDGDGVNSDNDNNASDGEDETLCDYEREETPYDQE